MSRAGAFLRRDALIALSYGTPLVAEVASVAVFLVTLVYMGRLVPTNAVSGGYLAFATVGIALLALVQAGLGVVGSNFRQEQVQGTLEVLLSAGLSTGSLALGMAAYPMIFALCRMVIYLVAGVAMGALGPGGNWPLALTAIGLATIAFSGLGLVAAALVLTIRHAAAAVGFLITLIALGSGVGFPRSLLPSWAAALAQASPLTHALDITRAALFDHASWGSKGAALSALAALTAAALATGFIALTLALHRARRQSAIAEY